MADPKLGSPALEIGESSWLTPLGLSDFVAIHVETIGLDPAADEIIELGAVRFVDSRPEAEFRSFIRATRPLDPFVADLTGISDADLQTAPQFYDVAAEFLEFLGASPLVSQNLDFDMAFLRAAGEPILPDTLENPWHFRGSYAVDTALIARTFWPENTGFTLPALADAFGISLTGLHRALSDARAIGELLVTFIRLLPMRVWRELTSDLQRLIDPTSHRSRPFFALLRRLAADIMKSDSTPAPGVESPAFVADAGTSLESLFGETGLFEQRLPFFKARPMQLAFARAAEDAFANNQILLAEAPTGVGKSLAYLTAALRWIQADPEALRQVVVSSHTKVLQDQLCRKDIAELRQAAGGDFRAAVLKGRANYLCKRRLRLVLREAGDRLSESDRLNLMPLLRWSELTATGDLAEIPAFDARRLPFLWSQIASDSQACAGGGCTAAKGDFYRLAQERAARAHIIFVNHALLLADLARFAAGPARKLILDEAHQIERAMVGAMTVEISAPLLRTILSRLVDERGTRGLLPTVVKRISRGSPGAELGRGRDLISQARSLHASVRQYFLTLADNLQSMLDSAERSSKLRFRHGQRLHAQIGGTLGPLLLQWNELASALRRFQQDLTDLRGDAKLSADLLVELRSAVDALEQSGEQFYRLLRETDANTVTWIEFGRTARTGWCALYAAPISVGAIMNKAFWPVIESAILTSATLTVGGRFEVLRNTLGLESQPENRLRELILDSPFRLDRQMRSFVPVFLPEPRQGGAAYAEILTAMITCVIERFSRGTLVLCTSNELVERLTTALGPVARRAGRRLLSQRASASLAELVAEFRRHGNAILVGAASFWEGIDVVGDALQILVVTRIPFDVPTEPWVAARTEVIQDAGRDPFLEYSLPVAALRLKQGIGRLIRHHNDRGIAILADPRLFKTRYGRLIRESLPAEAKPVYSEDELFREMERFFGNPVS